MTPYQLGVDLGTTFTAAATARDGRIEIVTLGTHTAAVPSVIFLREDDAILTGDAANRRGITEPARLAREFKRRLGDPIPILLGGTPYSSQALMAKLLVWVVGAVSEVQGEQPENITVSHPANWGPYKKDLLEQALRQADLTAGTIAEPEAAAIYYASTERLDVGSIVAVYDLGGGTFDAAVLRRTATGFTVLGSPEGIEHLGGIDFDETVFDHVARSVGEALTQLNADDPGSVAAVARLREDCTAAKEALSSDTDVSIPVLLPNLQTELRLTRAEFEARIRPVLADTVEALRRALRSADVTPDDVATVLLVGGSSRIPLVAEMLSAELGRPVAVDAHPKHAIALGAARAAAGARGGQPHATVVPEPGSSVALVPDEQELEPAVLDLARSPGSPPLPPPQGNAPVTTDPATVVPLAGAAPPAVFPVPIPSTPVAAPPPSAWPPTPTSPVPVGPINEGPINEGPKVTVATRPNRTSRSSNRLVLAAIAIGLLLLGAVALIIVSSRQTTSSSTAATTQTSGADTSSSSSTSSTAAPAQQFASQLDALLAQNAPARTEIVDAVNSLSSCSTSPDLAIASLNDAIAIRRSILEQMSRLPTDLLPQTVELLGDLQQAFDASIRADESFISWAQFVASDGCNGQARRNPDFDAAQAASTDATTAKQAFLTLWNPIAAQFGARQYTEADL